MKWLLVFALLFIAAFAERILPPLDQLQNLPIPSIDDIDVIKERCDEKAGAGQYEKIKEAKEDFQTYLKDTFNMTEIELELEEKAKTGSMEEVFGKICGKRSEVATYVVALADAIKPCLEESEKDSLNLTMSIMSELADFACYKNGDRIALFIAEGGVDCLQSHSAGIQKCAESVFDSSSNELPSFIFDQEKCNVMGTFQDCVVEELEKCEESTPANVVDALIRFVKKSACKDRQRKRSIFKRSAITDSFNQNEFKEKLMDAMRDDCKKYGTPNAFETLETNYDEAQRCIKDLQKNILLMTVGSASDLKDKVDGCMNATIKTMKECLPENEKFLPEFFLDVANSVMRFLMDNRNRLQTSSFTQELINCFQTYRDNGDNVEKLKNCIVDKFSLDDENLTKSKLCTQMEDVKSCISKEIDRVCIRDVTVNEFKNDLLDAFYKPCTN